MFCLIPPISLIPPVGGLELPEICGHRIHLEFEFVFLALVFGYCSCGSLFVLGAQLFAIVFSMIWHELGHAFAFSYFQCEPCHIYVHSFGGWYSNNDEASLTYRERMLCHLAGPLASLVFAGVTLALFWLAKYAPAVLGESMAFMSMLQFVVIVNFLGAGLNLLPLCALDGGQMTYCFFRKYTVNAAYYSAIIAITCLVPICLWLLYCGQLFLLLVFVLIGRESWLTARSGKMCE